MRPALGASLVLLGAGCSLFTKATVGVKEVDPTAVHARLSANAILANEPSSYAREALRSLDLDEVFDANPDEALRSLHRAAVEDRDRRLLYALAELSYATGKRLQSRPHFLAAAVYAYTYLFDERATEPPNPFDRRFRWACDLYNLGLERALVPDDLGRVDLASVPRALPVGTIDIVLDRSRFPWSEKQFARFLPADDFEIFGLSLRHRRSGLGVPLIGLPSDGGASGDPDPADKYIGKRASVPATAFLRFEGGVAAVEKGLSATLELRSGYDESDTAVGSQAVPLEADLTAPVAYSLHTNTAIWEFSLEGFFGGDPETAENRLSMLRPYERGRIPVVFVHGTASNPAYWAEMFNTLQADPVLRDSTQYWFFLYRTGYPIAYSAATLREALQDAVHTFDPEGTDPALRKMVVIGHSQGGLLTRLTVTKGEVSWLKDMFDTSFEEFEFTPEQEKVIRRCFEFDPVPEVSRVVFISTPHRGSFLAERPLARFVSGLIELPRDLIDLGPNLFTAEKGQKLPKGLKEGRIPTSVDNMDAKNPFLMRLGEAPIAPGVVAHSIIARNGGDSLEESTDGVVAYKSSHLEGVESEFVVPSGHSCQDKPLTIREVRRILVEHVRAAGKHPVGAAGGGSDGSGGSDG